MSEDPSYLSHLGEFATLKSVIQGYFFQSAFDIYGDPEGTFEQIRVALRPNEAKLLVNQLRQVLSGPNETLESIWSEYSDYMVTGTDPIRAIFTRILQVVEDGGNGV